MNTRESETSPRARVAFFGSDCDIVIGQRNCADSEEVLVKLNDSIDASQNDFTQTAIYRQLKPLFACMKMFGLYFVRVKPSRGKSYTEPIALFCFIVNTMAILNVVRSFTVFRLSDKFDNIMFQRLLFSIWSTECALKGSLMIWNCLKTNGLPNFFNQWSRVCQDARISKVCLFMMKKYIILSFLFIFVNSVVFTVSLTHVPILRYVYLEVVWRNASQFDDVILFVFKSVLTFLAILNSSSSIFPVSLFVILSFAVGKRLKKFSDNLRRASYQDDFHENIEEFRIQHEKLRGLVKNLDEIFSPLLAAVYFANIPMFCLVLYTLLSSLHSHLCIVLINLFWLSFILLQLTIVSVTASWIKEMVCCKYLLELQVLSIQKTGNI